MLLVSVVISHLAGRLRQQAEIAHAHEKQANAMHGLSRMLAGTRGEENIVKAAVDYIGRIFDSYVLMLLPEENGKLHLASGDPSSVFEKDIIRELHLAQSAYETGQMTGLVAQTPPRSEILYAPIQAADMKLGVFAIRPRDPERFVLQEQLSLVESLIRQVALALEVEHLTESVA